MKVSLVETNRLFNVETEEGNEYNVEHITTEGVDGYEMNVFDDNGEDVEDAQILANIDAVVNQSLA